jgi:predicted acetyltransferase
VKLYRPDFRFKETYLKGLLELTEKSDRLAWVCLGESADQDLPKKDFEKYVASLIFRETHKVNDWVRDTTFWAIHENQMVGRISIRHELNDFLREVGGHIGYIVHPKFRNQGFATKMLAEILKTDRAKEIGKLLLTCDESNVASEKTILKNGGVFERIVDLRPERPPKKHFWILA